MNWKNKITKSELKHMQEQNDFTLRSFKQTRETQIRTGSDKDCPCWECKGIAQKLGIK